MAIAALFFMIGFVTWLNGPLIAFVRVAFDMGDVGAFLVPLVFYLSYLLFSLPAAVAVRRLGLKRGMAVALVIMAVGTAWFGQCMTARVFVGALSGLLVLGAGLSVLQVAINPYVSLLGPPRAAAQRIAIMGICNKAAGILAPIALAQLVMRDIGGVAARARALAPGAEREALLTHFTHAVHAPYLAMASILLLAGIWVWRSGLPEVVAPSHGADAEGGRLFTPHFCLGVLVMFLYVGCEVLAGDAIGTYGAGFGLGLDQTKFFTTLTLAGMLAGYLTGLVVVPRFVSQARYMAFSCVLGVVFAVSSCFLKGYAAVFLIALLGFANAMIMPALFPLAIAGAGARTAAASSVLVMAFCGGAVLPEVFAIWKTGGNFQILFAGLTVPSYVLILFYSWRASRREVTAVQPEAVTSV